MVFLAVRQGFGRPTVVRSAVELGVSDLLGDDDQLATLVVGEARECRLGLGVVQSVRYGTLKFRWIDTNRGGTHPTTAATSNFQPTASPWGPSGVRSPNVSDVTCGGSTIDLSAHPETTATYMAMPWA